MRDNKIVADGQKRVRDAETYQEQVAEIRSSILQKYQAEHEQANFLQRWLLDLKIGREIRQEIKKLAPDDALYLTRTS